MSSRRYTATAAAAAKSLQSCPTVWSHRLQPTRLLRPWDSPGKNTGVGCHFLLQRMKVKSESEVAQSCPTQRPHGLKPTRLLHPWDFPGKSTGVECHCLLHIYIYIKPRILMQATWAQNPLKDDWLSAHRRVSCMYNHKEILISPFLLISHWKQKVPFKNMSYIL